MTSLVAISRFFTTSEVLPKNLVYRARLAIVLLAVALPLSDLPKARSALSAPGGLSVFPSDLLVLAAIVLWAGEKVYQRESPSASSPLLRWPLLLFAISLVPGIVRGHERYGEGLVGQPVRLVLYAAIALAVLKLRSRDVYWGIVAVLYIGTVWQLVLAGYSLATDSHQTGSYLLSTGGSRVLSLGAGMYLAAAFLIALLNVEFDRGRRRWLHLGLAGLALVAEALTFGRTTYVALVLLIPVVFLTLRETRSFVLRKWPVWVAFGIVAIAAAALTPSIGGTLVDRVSANPLNDSTVRWRIGSFEAALSGFRTGEWKAAETPDGSNRLSDPSFERVPIQDWHIQGGTMASVPVNFAAFQDRTLRFETQGAGFDEGPYSKPILTHFGQTWKFSVWLRGAQGGELVNVGIWEYGTDGSHTGYANLPVTLTDQLTYHAIQVTVTDPSTTYVRAILRTRSDAQKATVYADQAFLVSVSQPPPADPAENKLTNPGFETGTAEWHIQGGGLTFVQSPDGGFGKLAAQMTTDGAAVDEGMYSEAFPARKGEDWTFSIWLKGAEGHEVVGIELWQYGARGETTLETVSPFVLSDTMQRYSVEANIWRRDTTEIRALVRTWDSPQEVGVVMDQASLTKTEGSQGSQAGGEPTQPAAADQSWTGEEPLLGLGFGRSFNYIWNGYAYHLEGDPHNSYIWIVAGGGVFALATLLLLLGTFLWDAVRRARASISFERALVFWAIGTWFIFMINTFTGPILSDPSFLLTVWIVLLLPALVPRKRPPREFH